MGTKETKRRKVTIDYTDCNIGILTIEAEVLTHLNDIDGSQIILLKTDRRKEINDYMQNELINGICPGLSIINGG
jgi:hypothetical protein